MAERIIDLTGRGGLAPRFYGNLPYNEGHFEQTYLAEENQMADGFFNPFALDGYLSPANKSFNPAGTPSAIQGSTIVDPENDTVYLMDRGTKIHNIAFDGETIGDNHTITGDDVIGTDLEEYVVNGSRRCFYSYQKAGGGDIGIAIFGVSTLGSLNDTWLSSSATGGFNTGAANNTFMVVSDNGYMYVFDGPDVHKIDGTTSGGALGTATANILQFSPIFKIVDAINVRGKIWMAIVRTSSNIAGTRSTKSYGRLGGVYIWDRQSTTIQYQDFIDIPGIREIRTIFSFMGIPTIITISTTGYTEIRSYNNGTFPVVKVLGKKAYPLFRDSVSSDGDLIKWVGADGVFYVFGSVKRGEKAGIYKLGDVTVATEDGKIFTEAGAIVASGDTGGTAIGENAIPETYYIGMKDTGSSRVLKWYPHSYSAGRDAVPKGDTIYTKVIALPKLSTIKGITLFYLPNTLNPAATDYDNLDVEIYVNQSTTAYKTETLTKIADGNRGYKYIPLGKPHVNFIQIGFTWKVLNTAMSFAIKPMYAILEYEETKKIK